MPRSVWNGTLSFGLVSIPVSLFPATDPKDVRFHLFDREGRRVRYRRVVQTGPERAETGTDDGPSMGEDRERSPGEREVAYEELVRGYEVEPETVVFLDPEDIERARPIRSHTIDLEHFVKLEEIDPVYLDKTYYAVPGADAGKPYLLLLRSLQATGRVGIGRFVLRTKPHLVVLRPLGGVLALETLFFGDEVRDPGAFVRDLEDVTITQRELDIADQLIEALATDWDPSRYADEFREELLRVIAERTPEPIERNAPVEPPSRVEELMDALKRSVEEAKAGRRKKGRRAG